MLAHGARRYVRLAVAGSLLACLVATAVPPTGWVRADTQPENSGTVSACHNKGLCELDLNVASFFAHPGASIALGANGVITLRRAIFPVKVVPKPSEALGRFNVALGVFEALRDNLIRSDRGIYAVLPSSSVPGIASKGVKVELSTTAGGRTASCSLGANTHGHRQRGCQVITVDMNAVFKKHALPRAALTITVAYQDSEFSQTFTDATKGSSYKNGHYVIAFPVTYALSRSAKQAATVTVSVSATLEDGYYGLSSSTTFKVGH